MPTKASRSTSRAAHNTDQPMHEADKRLLDRMLFFSDAVFAIVLTIMVLDLRPPPGASESGDAAVWTMLAGLVRPFFAFIVSFALVGMWWSVHMRITRRMIRFDWLTAAFNFAFLLTVALVPFASSVLGEYGGTGAAWEIYWGVNAASSLTLTSIGLASSRGGGRLIGGTTRAERIIYFIRNSSPGLCFAAGIWLAANGHVVQSRYCWVLIPPIMVIMGWIQRRYR